MESQQTQKEEPKFKHKEAFCLMKYRSTRSSNTYIIWNSRDGVTPYTCLIAGEECARINFSEDKCEPNHQLQIGDLFFRDITPDEMVIKAQSRLEARNQDPWAPGNEELVRTIRNNLKETPVLDIMK